MICSVKSDSKECHHRPFDDPTSPFGFCGFVERRFRDRTRSQIRALPIPEATTDSIIDGGFFLHAWGGTGRSLVGRDFHGQPRQFDGPVRPVNGETDSPNVPTADRLTNELPNVEAVVIDDAGHLCNLQTPTAYTDAVGWLVEELRTNVGLEEAS